MKVRAGLDVLYQLLEESRFARQQRAIGYAIGLKECGSSGLNDLRSAIDYVVFIRYPSLGTLARQTTARLYTDKAITMLIDAIIQAPDNESVRATLTSAQHNSHR